MSGDEIALLNARRQTKLARDLHQAHERRRESGMFSTLARGESRQTTAAKALLVRFSPATSRLAKECAAGYQAATHADRASVDDTVMTRRSLAYKTT